MLRNTLDGWNPLQRNRKKVSLKAQQPQGNSCYKRGLEETPINTFCMNSRKTNVKILTERIINVHGMHM
jgi:hypothetical protein